MEGRLVVGLSIKKILLYAGITSLDTLVSGAILYASAEKSNVDEVNPQETGRSASGSSETLRKTTSPFNLVPFFRATGEADGNLVSFLEWLIGFTEGGGSFLVHSRTGQVRFQITQSYRDVRILYYVRDTLGFGSVGVQDAQNNTWKFGVSDKTNLKKIIALFNGNLVLEKNRVRFAAFFAAYSTRYAPGSELSRSVPHPSLNDA